MLTPTDTLCSVTTEMQDNNILVTTGAGTFQTKNARQQYSFFPPWTSPIQTRNLNRRYSKDVGIVIDTREFFSGDYYLIEKRLIRYHVN